MNDPIDVAIVGAATLIAPASSAGPAALKSAHRRGRLVEPALAAGTGPTAVRVVELLGNHPELGSTPQGFRDSRLAEQRTPLPLLGEPAEPANVVAAVRRMVEARPTRAEHVSGSAAGAAD